MKVHMLTNLKLRPECVSMNKLLLKRPSWKQQLLMGSCVSLNGYCYGLLSGKEGAKIRVSIQGLKGSIVTPSRRCHNNHHQTFFRASLPYHLKSRSFLPRFLFFPLWSYTHSHF